jgi:hypothetical protein
MPNNLLTNITHWTRFYLDLINDQYIGSGSSTGTGAQPYPGQLGGIIALSEAEAALRGSAITLHAGLYQYVNFLSGSTASNAAGQVVFWSSAANRAGYIVTPDAAATTIGQWAGITLGSVTKGYYGWVQIAGVANVKFKTGLGAGTPAIGDLVIVDQTPSNLADDPTQSNNPTYAIAKSILGVAQSAPVSNTTLLVQLWPKAMFQNL